MKYWLYIKSHCDYPDYEDDCIANSKAEAAAIFIVKGSLNREWTAEDLLEHICEAPEPRKDKKWVDS